MANATFDAMWQDAMGDLGEQLHVEGVDGDDDEGGGGTVRNTVRLFIWASFALNQLF
jgi:hypothetical protein